MAWPRLLRTRRRRLATALAPVTVVFLLGLIVLIQPRWAISALGTVFPEMIFRVETSSKLVALTFDDGPDDIHTFRVLEILARHQAHATFFMIGDRAVGRQGDRSRRS